MGRFCGEKCDEYKSETVCAIWFFAIMLILAFILLVIWALPNTCDKCNKHIKYVLASKKGVMIKSKPIQATTKNVAISTPILDSTLNIDNIILSRKLVQSKTDDMYKLRNRDIKRIAIIVARKINEHIMQRKYKLNDPFAGIKNIDLELKESIMQIFQTKGYDISIVTKMNVNYYKISWK